MGFETYFISLTRSVERFLLSIEFDDENDDNLMGEQSSLKKGFLAFVIVDELIHMKRKWLCIRFEGWSCDKLYYLIRDILCKQYFYEKLKVFSYCYHQQKSILIDNIQFFIILVLGCNCTTSTSDLRLTRPCIHMN